MAFRAVSLIPGFDNTVFTHQPPLNFVVRLFIAASRSPSGGFRAGSEAGRALAGFLGLLILCCAFSSPLPAAPPAGPVSLTEVVGLLEREFTKSAALEPRRLLRGALDEAAAVLAPLVYRFDGSPGTERVILRAGGAPVEFNMAALAGVERLAGLADLLERIAEWLRSRADGAEDPSWLLARGLLRTADPHALLLSGAAGPPGRNRTDGRGGTAGEVGITPVADGPLISLRAVRPGSPAAKAGLLPGDHLLNIAGAVTIGLEAGAAASLLHGKPGTTVRLLVLPRADDHPHWVTLRRTDLARPVTGRMVRGKGLRPVAYLRVGGFTSTTAEKARGLLEGFLAERQALAGIVLDLRGNPGGSLEEGIHLTDLFLERGLIVTLKGRSEEGSGGPVRARWYRTVSSLPLVVLVDEGTASAAEMVAGALKANHRAWVMGSATFGKNAVQSLFPLAGGHRLRLTVETFEIGGGGAGSGAGVMPHVVLSPVRSGGPVAGVRGLSALKAGWSPLAERFPPAAYRPLLVLPFAPKGGPGADYPLALALRLLRFNTAAHPSALYLSAPVFLRGERQRQERRIVDGLRERGLDWSSGNAGVPGGPGHIVLGRLTIFARPSSRGRWRKVESGVREGEQIRISLLLKNPGPEPLHRVLGVIASAAPYLDGLELPLGALPPGTTGRAEARAMLPQALPEGREAFQVVLSDGHGRLLGRHPGTLMLRPMVAAGVRLEAAFFKAPRTGATGAGVRAPSGGERLSLRLRLHNPAAEPLDALGVWLATPRPDRLELLQPWRRLPALRGGGTHLAWADMVVASPGSGPPPRVLLTLIGRTPGASEAWGSISLRAAAGRKGVTFQAPRIAMSPLPTGGRGNPRRIRGQVLDDAGVRDVAVFLNGSKIDYRRAAAPRLKRMPFSLEAPLKPGRNRLRVVARDSQGLTAERIFLLWP